MPQITPSDDLEYVGVRLPRSQREALQRLSETSGRNRSDIIRRVIDAGLAQIEVSA